MKIGICGKGFVGNAIYNFFINNTNEDNLYIYDKYKNINTFDILLLSEILFICLPTNYDSDKNNYDMDEINNTIYLLNENKYNGIIIIKSTVLPDYCSNINNLYPNLKIIANPEFLSARTASEDFANQTHIILGYTKYSINHINIVKDFYNKYFQSASISITSAEEAFMVKLGCNSFYATKVQFFTELYLLCKNTNMDYNNVKNMMLKNNWINPMHTNVPGPDNNISYGGACLPKDTKALNEYMKKNNLPNDVINAVVEEREKLRK